MGLFDIGSSLLQVAGSIFGNEQKAEAAREQMSFQKDMSDTAHQREVMDLSAAGLNPMLSVMHSGASTPAGAMSQPENVISPAVATALQAKLVNAQVDQLKSQAELNEASKSKVDEDAIVSRLSQGRVSAQTTQALSSANQVDALTSKVGREIAEIEERIKTAPYDRYAKESSADLDRQLKLLRGVETTLRGLEVNQGKVNSEFFGGAVGESSPYVRMILQILSTLKK